MSGLVVFSLEHTGTKNLLSIQTETRQVNNCGELLELLSVSGWGAVKRNDGVFIYCSSVYLLPFQA